MKEDINFYLNYWRAHVDSVEITTKGRFDKLSSFERDALISKLETIKFHIKNFLNGTNSNK